MNNQMCQSLRYLRTPSVPKSLTTDIFQQNLPMPDILKVGYSVGSQLVCLAATPCTQLAGSAAGGAARVDDLEAFPSGRIFLLRNIRI